MWEFGFVFLPIMIGAPVVGLPVVCPTWLGLPPDGTRQLLLETTTTATPLLLVGKRRRHLGLERLAP